MKRLLLAALAVLVIGASPAGPSNDYRQEVLKWRENRRTSLTSDNGWLTLVGLHWLGEGENTFGSAKANNIVLQSKVPARCGSVVLHDGIATLKPAPAAGLKIDGKPVTGDTVLVPDTDPQGPTIVEVGTARVQLIKRDDIRQKVVKYALRVKDPESPARAHFKGLDYFAVNPKWRLQAHFEPFNPPRHVPITNVLGMTSDEVAPGLLVFNVSGKEYRIEPILEQGEKDYFIIFRDSTSGKETYGAARYVYAAPPGPDGKTIIDFNKAYNPPCAFTPFATCPLPPPQNKLPFRIEAGEKKYAGGHG